MSIFIAIEDNEGIFIYPRNLVRGKTKLVFIALGSLVFILLALFIIISGRDASLGWKVLCVSGLSLSVTVLQLAWNAPLIIDDETLYLRPNPFLPQVNVQWEEIGAIMVHGRRYLSLDFTLSPAHADTFLYRQSPRMRRILTRRIERTGGLHVFLIGFC